MCVCVCVCVRTLTCTVKAFLAPPGFHLRGGGGGAQGKLPPQTAQLPPQTDPTSPPKILPIIIIMKSTLPLPWPYSHMIRELPPQDEIPR